MSLNITVKKSISVDSSIPWFDYRLLLEITSSKTHIGYLSNALNANNRSAVQNDFS